MKKQKETNSDLITILLRINANLEKLVKIQTVRGQYETGSNIDFQGGK